MPPMKLTPIAAMRARDVSRPRAEHLAEAEAAEVTPPGSSRAATPSGAAAKGNPGTAADGTGPGTAGNSATGEGMPTGDERTGRPGYPRRRRGPRDSGRRGRSSR